MSQILLNLSIKPIEYILANKMTKWFTDVNKFFTDNNQTLSCSQMYYK